MLTPTEAERAIREAVPRMPVESLPLAAAVSKVLRQEVTAERDQPPFHRVTMDGIAFDSGACTRGLREFQIAGTQAAGAPQSALPDQDACFEVMTGAVLPAGCDCVIPVERIVIEGDRARLLDNIEPKPWLNVHIRGLDSRAGERLLTAGSVLGSSEIAVIASAGLARVDVSRAPRIIVISTGDELVEPGEPIADYQIRRSNAYAVVAALNRHGFREVAQDHLPDDPAVLKEDLRRHLDTHDVLVLSGGVSMGRFDYVPEVLSELGVKLVFHKVAQRPGKPMWFGVRAPDKVVYALPGNPVSTLICLTRYVLPGLAEAMAATRSGPDTIALGSDYDSRPELTVFLPVTLSTDATGRTWAHPRPTKGSGDFTSLLGSDGFVELPPGPQLFPRGRVAPLWLW